MLQNSTISAKIDAKETINDQIPKDSPILEGFDKLQSGYNLFEERIFQVYHQLNSIDKKFNQENYTNKETDATYVGKYASLISEIIKLIEEEKEKEEEPPPRKGKGGKGYRSTFIWKRK